MNYGAFMQILMIWEYQQQNTYRISVLNPDMNLLTEYYMFGYNWNWNNGIAFTHELEFLHMKLKYCFGKKKKKKNCLIK